jgi:predicted nucleotidyltransferase component of viral defense system
LKLHQRTDDFRAAIQNAAAKLNLPEHVVEKDYWVTKTLFNLSNYEHKEYVVFKGGTALSKGYGLIKRFSEDIDLALHPDGVGEGKIHKRMGDALHRVVTAIKDDSFTVDEDEKESEKQRYKRVYLFPQIVEYPEGSPIHSKIVVEVNSFSTPVPVESVKIKSLVAGYLHEEYGSAVVVDEGLDGFEIYLLKPERIFCEKLLALRRASFRGGDFFAERIRHVYDIHQMFQSKRILDWVNNEKDFFELLDLAHQDDEINKKISAENQKDFISYKIFSEPKKEIESVETAYENLKAITFDQSLPLLDEVSESLKELSVRLRKFNFS